MNCARATNECKLDIAIEQVSDRCRALDVMVFRGFSISAKEYQYQYFTKHNQTISEQESVVRLTSGINDNGCDTNILGGSVVTFIARMLSDDSDKFARTNGVIATVDAKVTTDCCIILKNLNVDERVRRRGVASALVKAVKDFTRTTESISEVVLDVDRQNLNAIALYEKEGFEFDEKVKGDGRMVWKILND
jgi:RimJ/RimL family protein N-acetyltransferase